MADDQEFDLASLTDDELVEQMHNDLYDGLADEIVSGTNILLARGWGAGSWPVPRWRCARQHRYRTGSGRHGWRRGFRR